jgi:primosomal protein N' (replication factor Y)
VIVGPRSALFAPIKNIGLVVVDEAHDNAYKQDQSPYYHALRVAGKLAQIHEAQLIFGTATPLVSEYFILETKKIPILRLTEIAAGNAAPAEITVIDAHDRTGYTKNPYLSDALIESLAQKLKNKEQSLVFLNRRGTARLVMCQKCNWQALCPRCSLPLTYHSDSHSMRCHTCGYKEVAPTICPICSSTEVVYKSIGTKALTTMLQSIFPDAQIQRFDTDNAQDEKLERHYDSVLAGNVDILVGTQILVKGLDLPKLSLVGIIAADSSLYFPDYTAEEQTYQLLSQVIGRVGRGHRQSNVVIQTYNTSGKSLNAVLNKNWIEFYQQQLSERRQYFFPPFCYVMKLSCSRKTQASAMKNAQALVEKLKTSGLRIEVTGPSPRFIEQTNGNYNWQIIVKATQRIELIKALSLLPANWTYNLDPTNLL